VSNVLTDELAQSSGLLAAARRGGERAFGELVEPCRAELEVHCYRMLASADDAEDAVQEALLRAWRGLSRFESRSTLRSWLYRIATNVCLDAIERRLKRVLAVDEGLPEYPRAAGGEVSWIGPFPDEVVGVEDGLAGPEARYEQRETVELAFIAALQMLGHILLTQAESVRQLLRRGRTARQLLDQA